MIVVAFRGGLGNQMFQYAAGLAFAEEYKTEVFFDLGHLKADSKGIYTQRNFELDAFDLEIKFADEALLKKFNKNKLEILLGIRSSYIALLDDNPDLSLISSKNVYLDGFWQNEKYFIKYKEKIRNAFQPKEKISEQELWLIEKMKSQNSLSLHVRRGDYVTNTNANAFHGVCSVDYYKKAIEYIASKTPIDQIYIFSDDTEWCKKELRFDIPTTVIENNKERKSYVDLLLMSNCKNNIIANSSFSWWGAWLNSNPVKIVIGPNKWVNDPNANTKDIIPKTWIKI